MSQTRQASLRALAKINLDLRVLHARPDGYHEIRTIFQTISLADIIDVEFTRARGTTIQIDGDIDIPDNLIAQAAILALHAIRVTARVRFRLRKRIPMGAGLGGGSSDAAAVLLALPALAGHRLALPRLMELAAELLRSTEFEAAEGPERPEIGESRRSPHPFSGSEPRYHRCGDRPSWRDQIGRASWR